MTYPFKFLFSMPTEWKKKKDYNPVLVLYVKWKLDVKTNWNQMHISLTEFFETTKTKDWKSEELVSLFLWQVKIIKKNYKEHK